ncbi:MAG TPA: hypothetical protein VLL94_04655 [Nitrospiraceae bacterium]|nr:hypothetical protein [Nitrospiraceae bacterium]
MAGHIHPRDIPPRYYKPLGQLVAGWNLTEALLSSIIWHFHKIKDPRVGRLFTYRMSSVERLRVFKLTAEKHVPSPAITDSMRVLRREAETLRGRHNTFVHGLWGRMPNEKKTWKVFFLKDTDHTDLLRREVITLQDLIELAARIRKLNVNLDKFRVQIGAPPP